MKKRFLGIFLMLAMVLALAVNASAAAKCTVSFTCPSDVTVRVAKGFANGVDDEDGVEIARTSVSTEGDTSTYVFTLEEGRYRFLAQDVAGPTSNKYYNWDKNFLVTAADVAAGSKTIDADPGLLANTGWEQKRDTPGYYVRQFTDELLASEASVVSEELKEKYAYVYTTPTFTVEGKARHQFTTQSEMEDFVAEWDEKTDYMSTYVLGRSKGDKHDLRASIFTTEDLTGKTLAEAAEAVQANGKPTMLLHAQMHGDEQSGTEGALATVVLLCGEYGAAAIEKVNIILIPRVNPDGSQIYKYESGSGSSWRNINRDSLEVTQPETALLINLYNLFEPEACYDFHEFRATTDYDTESHLDDVRLSEQVSLNLPSEMIDIQYEIVDYMHEQLADDGMRGYYYRSSPSTGPVTMRSYYAARGSISMLGEIPGQRKGSQQWDRRVLAQHLAVKSFMDYVIENADKVNETVNAIKAELATYGSVYDENNLFVVDHNPGTQIKAKRYIFDMADGSLIEHRVMTNIYRNDSIGRARPRPIYYAIPKDASGISKVLSIADIHGIEYSEVGPDKVMELRGYTGSYKAAELKEPELYSFENGAYIFPVAQVRTNILCTLMEPDILDAQEADSPYKASYVIQGHLQMDELYRCENDSEHALTFVPAKGATCDTEGCKDHYLCLCGKAFAADEHKNALAEEDYIIPVSGHDFVEQEAGGFTCSFDCGTTAADLAAAVAACDGVGGTVKANKAWALTEGLVIPTGVTLDMGEWMLEVPAGLVVNEGGAVTNGNLCVSKTSGAVVNLGSNGGWVPVCYAENDGEALYALYRAEAKTGKDVTYFDNGTKYAFGYKFDNAEAYAAAVAAGAESIKLGVNVSLQAGGIDADYSFSEESIAKMNTVGTGADDFFKVNLSLTGEKVDDVVATPYIKVTALGFRTEGTKSTDFIPVTEVAAFGGEKYTTLSAAVAAAEAAGGVQDIDLLADIAYKRPTTLKMNGNVRFVAKSTADITISGPLTIDGQNKDGGKLLFQVQDEAKLTLNGVTIENYRYTNASSNYGAVGRVEDEATLVMKDCIVRNCEGARRGAFYITGASTVNIDGCTFEGNVAKDQYGGALAIYNTKGVTIRNSSFIDNSCVTYGGAIGVAQYNENNGAVTIENCTFTGNSAEDNGGGIAVKSGPLVIKGVTMSGNELAGVSNDIDFVDGTFALSGNVAIETVKLASGKSIALDDTLSAAAPIAIDAAIGQVVLTGSKVADYNELFVGTADDLYVSETGKLLGAVVYVASVNGTQYTSLVDAVEAANEAAAATTSTVTVNIFGDETFTAPVTVTPAANVQLSFTASVTLDGPLTIDGQELTRKIVPIAAVASDDAASGKTVTFKGTTIKNIHRPISTSSSGNYGAALRTNAYNTIVLDGATLTGNKGEIGGVYITSNGSVVVKNNSVVSNNESLAGFNQGVIFLNGTSSSLVASDSTFSGNVSATRGIITVIGKKSSFTNCVFENNSGSYLGVIHTRNANTVLPVEGCTFTNNTSTAANGAAIYSVLGSTTVTNSAFTGNTRNVYIEGGTVTGVTN